MFRTLILATAAIVPSAVAGPAEAAPSADQEVRYGAAPSWLLPPPAPTAAPTPAEAPVRVAWIDSQLRVTEAGQEIHSAYRIRILKPEALAAGNISVEWNPAAGHVTVHRLHIIRDGETIDVLRNSKFRVIQREDRLAQSMLDGQLTAVLQTPGLAVGDELEFAATVLRRDPTLGERAFGIAALPPMGSAGAYRIRLLWPEGVKLAWRGTPDLDGLAASSIGRERQLLHELRDPRSVIVNDGAPPRANVRRLIEYSDFADWSEVSRRVWPLFDAAATVKDGSDVRREAARIAEATRDPLARAQAALLLVQDRVRYVYVGLDGGNYRPASVDETWERRFGDCKAKTALLLALLEELGVEAEAALVHSSGGDAIGDRLASPGVFDHVVVRAIIGGRDYWLDGTRQGDRAIAMLPPVAFRYALPLRKAGADLMPVAPQPARFPQLVGIVELDASAGFDKPAGIDATNVIRGDEAWQLRSAIAGMAPDDATRALKGYWTQNQGWAEPDEVGWRYDDARAALVLTMRGEHKPDWEGDAKSGRTLNIVGAGFTPPAEYRRPKEQDQRASWVTEFPRYRCWSTTIRLPKPAAGRVWDYRSAPVDVRLGGVRYWRQAALSGDVMRTVMSRHVYLPEITADEAAAVNARLPTFDNKISYVAEIETGDEPTGARNVAAPFTRDTDWVADPSPCGSPE